MQRKGRPPSLLLDAFAVSRPLRSGVAALFGALLGLSLLLVTPAGVVEAAAPCDSDPQQPAAFKIAPPAVGADLSEPFKYETPRFERTALLGEVVQVVKGQAADLGADACFQEKPERIATRVDFLSPFEFLVVSMFGQEPERRDALLERYAVDPRGAIEQLGEAFPSTRAQATMVSYAYYDVSSDRIRVNVDKVPPDQLRRVLVHEFWHAMPHARTWTEADGRILRASGFWLQEQQSSRRIWVPVEDRRGLPYASYLLDEAMAALMETRYAGKPQFARAELEEVQGFLDRLMSVAGSETVLREYLESRPYELAPIAEAHRSSFPDLEVVARP